MSHNAAYLLLTTISFCWWVSVGSGADSQSSDFDAAMRKKKKKKEDEKEKRLLLQGEATKRQSENISVIHTNSFA